MAESIVTFFLQKLSDLLAHEAFLVSSVEEQVKLLSNELEWMRLFLKDADAKRRYDPRIKLWVSQIRDVTYDAEDVIDEFMFEMNRQQRNGLKCLKSPKLVFAHKLESRIKEINNKIGKIMENKSRYGVETLPDSSSSNDAVRKDEKRLPIVEDVNVVGLQDGAKRVKQMLLNGERRRAAVSIVGMGGLGKTTLARKIYNGRDVKQHFDCHAWIYVSQEYTIRELLLEIADCLKILSKEEKREMNESELGNKLREYLTTRKYLIVMDDVWRTEAWDRLSLYFPDLMNGSRVLITSRNKEIGLHADPETIPHELSFLTADESWELFLKKIFPTAHTNCPRELEETGKEIVANCRGLPLAIVVLGGFLSRKEKTQLSWQRVLHSVTWHLNQGPDSCMGILALSYNDMPYYLKSCFLYCGLFPEDSEIMTAKLIRLWVAEGFIQRRGEETVEDVAEDHLQELIDRSMVQVAAKSAAGRVESCRMHDLLRDLAISEAKEAHFFFEGYESIDSTHPGTVRRLTVHRGDNSISEHLHGSRLRSFICFSGKEVLRSLHGRVKLLKILDLEGMRISTLPEGIGELVHLKYLCLRGTSIRRLPSSIDNLVNLQTLDFWRTSVETIPGTIWKLHNLRHLYGVGAVSSQSWIGKRMKGPLGVGDLTNLQSLDLLWGSWCNSEGLGKLNQLRELSIRWFPTSEAKKGRFFESLQKLTALQRLSLLSLPETGGMPVMRQLMPFSAHAYLYDVYLSGRLGKISHEIEFYPPNLSRLELDHVDRVEQDPMVTLEKLPNLRSLLLKLNYCAENKMKMVCSSRGFQRLEKLDLRIFRGLEELIVENGAMPHLRTLSIDRCEELKKFPSGLLQLKNLECLELFGVSQEVGDEVTQTSGEDWEKIRQITSMVSGEDYIFNLHAEKKAEKIIYSTFMCLREP